MYLLGVKFQGQGKPETSLSRQKVKTLEKIEYRGGSGVRPVGVSDGKGE